MKASIHELLKPKPYVQHHHCQECGKYWDTQEMNDPFSLAGYSSVYTRWEHCREHDPKTGAFTWKEGE